MKIHHIETILYVRDQEQSRAFYENLFDRKADLDVPGMTEFNLSDHFKLGLMPSSGTAKILKDRLPHPNLGHGIPRCELYLLVDDPDRLWNHALACQAIPISEVQDRNWGDRAGYVADPDGHVLAFAKRIQHSP